MNKYIMKDAAITAVDTINDTHKCNVNGDYDANIHYNEGFSDACECILDALVMLPESDVVSTDYKQFFDEVSCLPDCNTCADRDCKYMPKPGQVTRFNCPLWRGKDDTE